MPYGVDAGKARESAIYGKEGGGGRGSPHPWGATWAYTPFRENLKSSVNLYLSEALTPSPGVASGGTHLHTL
jgi:hypothetical protein